MRNSLSKFKNRSQRSKSSNKFQKRKNCPWRKSLKMKMLKEKKELKEKCLSGRRM